MKKRLTAIISGIALSITFFGLTSAQVCRVTSGKQSNGTVVYTEVYEYDYVDEKPKFPGGGQALVNFINSNRKYPEEAYNQGIQGRVTCAFVIDTIGKVDYIKVLRGVEPSLNAEAVRIISSMPHWEAGKLNGEKVPVRVVCCIPFRK